MVGDLERRYRVSQITTLIRQTLEADFSDVAVEGELSNVRPSSTGHLYFTLKDNDAVLSGVMFRSRARSLTFRPEDGQVVIARGNISVYAKRGTYQIICESLEQAGEGEILALLEQRKRKLAAEGLFDEERKKPLPLYPSRIAVVTSPTGAALRDILRVIGRRSAGVDVVVLPAPVQGDTAAAKIAKQIRIANLHHLGDVVIVGRGGGSLEDLLPFSEEEVVRAVAASELPVISAVGHEVDIALCDLAADVRAPTPSAAAEIVSVHREELLSRVETIRNTAQTALRQRVERIRILLRQFSPALLERNFRIFVQPSLLALDDAKERLVESMERRVEKVAHRLELARRELETASPLKTLEKGYSIVSDTETGAVLTSVDSTGPGARVHIRFHKGAADAEIEEVQS